MKSFLLFALTFLGLTGSLSAQYTPGQTYWGANNFIEYRAGALPIIISAPHGGTIAPDSIPDRTCSACVVVRDLNTLELAQVIDTMITQIFGGCRPHIIISHLHRKKMDANRDSIIGAQGNLTARQAWEDYHGFLTSAKNNVLVQQQEGILIDLHGHGHDIQRLELGYLLTGNELQLSDNVLAQPPYPDEVSIRNLVDSNLNQLNLPQLLRGDYALGSLLQAAGYPAVPSNTDPAPAQGDPYFNGGYITAQYGSLNNGHLDAIQIETNYTGVRNNASNRAAFATALANSLQSYLNEHYFTNGIPCALTLSASALDGFQASCQNGKAELSWSVSASGNPVRFTIQSSLDGIVWENRTVLPAESGKNDYRWLAAAPNGTFFRLATQDLNGETAYSPIRQIACTAPDFKLFPNPNSGQFSIDPPLRDQQEIRVRDMLGRVIATERSGTGFSIHPSGLLRVEIWENGRLLWGKIMLSQ